MKKYQSLSLLLFFLLDVLFLSAQTPFTKGVNLTGWFQTGNTRSIPFTKFNKKDIENIKSLGCDVIRLPISLHYFTSGAPDYKVDTLFYQYLDQVIDWTEELQMNLIIDNHTIEVATSKTVETPLLKIWPQMARHYKDRSTAVFYEILNEPNTLAASDWASIQSKVVTAIRAIDNTHTIIVTGADWGGIGGLIALKKLADPNLIYSFHFYDPFLFTHQGATWTNPSMGDLKNVPFPYDATRMPACPTSLKGTWIEGSLSSSYKTDGTMAKIKSSIDAAANYAKTNGVKIYCGEFGVYNLNSLDVDRVSWYKQVPAYISSKLIPWTMWDYQGGFGLFNKGSNETFEYDINRPLAEGMGFTLPPYKEYVFKADTVPFDIYTDYPGQGIISSVPGSGTADLFSTESHQGNFGIYYTDVTQYSNIEFKYKLTKDMSLLVAANYTLDFWVKADSPGSDVVLRFVDTKTADPKDHPWRKDYKLNSSVVPFDGQWHLVQIPLNKFIDAGSYDGSWYSAANLFDWKAVDRFQIVAESMALTGKKFWFDDIRINGTPLTTNIEQLGGNEFNVSIFPNPVNKNAMVQYDLKTSGLVNISLYNLAGKKVAMLLDEHQFQGRHQVNLSAEELKLTDGIYVCKITSTGKSSAIKIVVNR